jgi:DNA invertase Pin-like site-specific DNA recombinase
VLSRYARRRCRVRDEPSAERQAEGIAQAKAEGVYTGKGRPASIDSSRVLELKAEGLGATEIAKALGIARASVYRVLAAVA